MPAPHGMKYMHTYCARHASDDPGPWPVYICASSALAAARCRHNMAMMHSRGGQPTKAWCTPTYVDRSHPSLQQPVGSTRGKRVSHPLLGQTLDKTQASEGPHLVCLGLFTGNSTHIARREGSTCGNDHRNAVTTNLSINSPNPCDRGMASGMPWTLLPRTARP